MASPQVTSGYCANPNFFSSVIAPAVEKRLPAQGTLRAYALDHTTNVGPFFRTVSEDLCDDGRMSQDSAESAIRFVSRSATSAVVVGGTAALGAAGLVVGSPAVAVGAGAVGLAALPPLVERAAFGIINFASDVLQGVRNYYGNE